MTTNKLFRFDALIEEEDFCNFKQERQKLFQEIAKNHKVLLYGRRNFGKTSLIRNIVARDWIQGHPRAFFIYVDFYGVRSMAGIVSRLSAAFADAYHKAFPAKAMFNAMLNNIKQLRPKVEIEPDGKFSLGLGLYGSPEKNLNAILHELRSLHDQEIPTLVVFDEFQDIHFVEEAEGIMRGEMEAILAALPIVVLGSKKHLLAKMFSRPNAPFFNWGNHIEMQFIAYEEYSKYANERFSMHNLEIDQENSVYLQDLMGRIPEAMNRLGGVILDYGSGKKQKVSRAMIDSALEQLVTSRCGAMEEYISHFTDAEERLLVSLAHMGGRVAHMTGKDFIAKSSLSISGIRKVVTKLENDAVLYQDSNGYGIADPLLFHHFLKYRSPIS